MHYNPQPLSRKCFISNTSVLVYNKYDSFSFKAKKSFIIDTYSPTANAVKSLAFSIMCTFLL